MRARLREPGVLQVMAAHSPLSARLVEEAGFDGIWASGFELSALLGLPDMSMTTMTQHLEMVRAMAEQCGLPIVADIDSGFGNALNVIRAVTLYERAGASAVVLEDKVFPKVTSLVAQGRQELVRIDEFRGKIAAATDTRRGGGFLVIARTEALIAGRDMEEALERAYAYEDAGADMILVHSKRRTADEVRAFVGAWGGACPLVIVPTSYPALTIAEVVALKRVKMVIFGNHAIRASVQGMQRAFARIRSEGSALAAVGDVVTVEELFRLQRMDRVKADEARYLQ